MFELSLFCPILWVLSRVYQVHRVLKITKKSSAGLRSIFIDLNWNKSKCLSRWKMKLLDLSRTPLISSLFSGNKKICTLVLNPILRISTFDHFAFSGHCELCLVFVLLSRIPLLFFKTGVFRQKLTTFGEEKRWKRGKKKKETLYLFQACGLKHLIKVY